MRVSSSLAFLLLPAVLQAAPEDFARGAVISTTDPGMAQRVILDADVYQWATSEELGDVRILDSTGSELPYAVRRPPPAESHTGWRSLPVFALPQPASAAEAATAVDIELGKGGAVVAVRGPSGISDDAGYLVDASDYPYLPAELALSWGAAIPDFVARLQVEASDDLNQWRTLMATATVAALHTDGERVLVDRIALPPVDARYLRLLPLDRGTLPPIKSVEVRSRVAKDPVRHWRTLTGSAKKNGFEFDAGGWFPVDRVEAALARDTFLIDARIFSRADPGAPWQDHGVHRFYRASVNGKTAASEPMINHEPTHRWWRLELLDGQDAVPKLRIGWLPDELVFLRQGDPPYLLAYGRAGLKGRQWPIAELLSQFGEDGQHPSGADSVFANLPVAELSAPTTLGGEARLQPPARIVHWRTLVLWAVLVAGVGLLATLAYRMIRSEPGI